MGKAVITVINAKWARRLAVDAGAHRIAHVLGALIMTAWAALLGIPVPSASGQPCPDVEVVFARGTGEPPGVGGVGQAFVDSLSSQLGARSVGVYPVNYPASSEFVEHAAFARSLVDGIRDASAHIESTAAHCPNTRMVLGGYSQGATLAGFVTSAAVPKQVPADYVSYGPKPMPPEVANHVAAVTLFGTPSAQFLAENGAPPMTVGPLYEPKTIDLCTPDDPICNEGPGGGSIVAHLAYPFNGMTDEAADFAASRL